MPEIISDIKNGNIDTVKEYILKGNSIHTVEGDDRSLLVAAVEFEKLDIVELLIETKANCDDMLDKTPCLLVASQKSNLGIVKALLAGGCNVRAVDKHGSNALLIAVQEERRDVNGTLLSVAIKQQDRLLAQYAGGSAVCENDELEDTENAVHCDALDNIENEKDPFGLYHPSNRIVKVLIAAGIDVNHQNKKGFTALLLAVDNRLDELVRFLILKGADANIVHKHTCKSALMMAVSRSGYDIIMFLLSHGANPNLQDVEGNTVLHFCARSVQNDSAKMLINAYGANVDILNKREQTAHDLVPFDVFKPFFKKEHNVKCSALCKAVLANDAEAVNSMLKRKEAKNLSHGNKVNAICLHDNNEPMTALMQAVLAGHLDMVKLLVQTYKANINRFNYPEHGISILMQSVRYNFHHITTFLCQNGALFECAEEGYDVELHDACLSGTLSSMKTWVKLGADINHRGVNYETPLTKCVQNYYEPGITYLLELEGIEPYFGDSHDMIPLQVATYKDSIKCVEALLRGGVNPDVIAPNKDIPLNYAVEHEMKAIVQLLYEYDAQIMFYRSETEQTVLMKAVVAEDVSILEMTMERLLIEVEQEDAEDEDAEDEDAEDEDAEDEDAEDEDEDAMDEE